MQISGNVAFAGNWSIASPIVSNVVANISTTYSIVEASNVISEPYGNIKYTVTTTYGSNTTLYWQLYVYPEESANTVAYPSNNFSGNTLTGSFSLAANVGTFLIFATNNNLNSGNTINWIVKVKTGSTAGPNVVTSNVFTYVILN